MVQPRERDREKGRERNSVKECEAERAMECCAMHTFNQKLPGKWATVAPERGINSSSCHNCATRDADGATVG